MQPQRVLAVEKNAVAVDAQAQSPASVSIAQVLQRCVPDQPVEQQRVIAPKFGGTDHHQPGGVRGGLGSRQGLQLVQPPLQAGARAFHRFTPWIGRIGRESVTARAQGRKGCLDRGPASGGLCPV